MILDFSFSCMTKVLFLLEILKLDLCCFLMFKCCCRIYKDDFMCHVPKKLKHSTIYRLSTFSRYGKDLEYISILIVLIEYNAPILELLGFGTPI